MSEVVSSRTEVRYRIRQTGEVVQERIFSEHALRWFYEDPLGSRVFEVLLNRPGFCWLYGKIQDLPGSRRKIPEFVATHGIPVDEAEYPLSAYETFNDFFARRLKPQARPFALDPRVFACPADGKVLVFPALEAGTRVPIKGASLTISALLESQAAAKPYVGGSALVIRLAPYDYHRFHFPDGGVPHAARPIKGRYHSVSPIALAKVPDLFCRNKREATEFISENFQRLCYVEVGALCVGTIVQRYLPGVRVSKGDEKGYFRFGGSTVVLLFEPGAIVFDDDLVRDSAAGMEVHVLAGSGIGRRP